MPRRQNESFCKTIHNERCLICTFIFMQIKVSLYRCMKRFSMMTCFETETKGNSKMAYSKLFAVSFPLISPFAPFCLSSFILYPTTQAPKGVLCWPQGLSFTVVLSRWGSRLFTSCIKLHAIREIIALCEEELSQAFRIEEDLCFFLEPFFLNSTLVLKQITPGLSNDQKWVG